MKTSPGCSNAPLSTTRGDGMTDDLTDIDTPLLLWTTNLLKVRLSLFLPNLVVFRSVVWILSCLITLMEILGLRAMLSLLLRKRSKIKVEALQDQFLAERSDGVC